MSEQINYNIKCKCGCGENIKSKNAKFIRGHYVLCQNYTNMSILCKCGCGFKRLKYHHNKIITTHYIRNHENNKIISCICGCGETLLKYDKYGREIKYIIGHGRKGVIVSKETIECMRISNYNIIITNKRFYNTTPERFLKSILSVNGIKYESQKRLYGRPDIFIQPNICIFVDGCYWHGCNECMGDKRLKYKMIRDKIKRDPTVNQKLENQGYNVIRIWEHDIHSDLMMCLEKIRGMM